MTTTQTTPPICDYEGSPYRTAFWNDERRYEDLVASQRFFTSARRERMGLTG